MDEPRGRAADVRRLDFADFAFHKKALPAASGKLEYKPDPKAFS